MDLKHAIVFFSGVLAGGLIAWLAAALALKGRFSKVVAENRAEIARLEEGIQGKTKELEEKDNRTARLQDALNVAEATILKVSEERSAANAKLEHMGRIQRFLDEKTQEAKGLEATISALKEKQVAMETVLEKERAAMAEKLQLLEKAEARFSDTFQALSAKALRNSQESFLELAKVTLADKGACYDRDVE